jgi:hypothetical protein
VAWEGKDPAGLAPQALALEGYRTERFAESDLRQMLGPETGMEIHAFLKQHGVPLPSDVAEFEQDKRTSANLRRRLHRENAPRRRRSADSNAV